MTAHSWPPQRQVRNADRATRLPAPIVLQGLLSEAPWTNQPVDLSARRHRRRGPYLRNRQGRRRVRELDRLEEPFALGDGGRQRSAESIAGTRGVDRRHLDAVDEPFLRAVDSEHTLRSHGYDHALRSLAHQDPRRLTRVPRGGHGDAGEDRGLHLVGGQDVHQSQELVGHLARRSRVEDDADSLSRRYVQRGIDSDQVRLQLSEKHGVTLYHFARALYIGFGDA